MSFLVNGLINRLVENIQETPSLLPTPHLWCFSESKFSKRTSVWSRGPNTLSPLLNFADWVPSDDRECALMVCVFIGRHYGSRRKARRHVESASQHGDAWNANTPAVLLWELGLGGLSRLTERGRNRRFESCSSHHSHGADKNAIVLPLGAFTCGCISVRYHALWENRRRARL